MSDPVGGEAQTPRMEVIILVSALGIFLLIFALLEMSVWGILNVACF
jgi:hypothetical protein